MATTPLQKLTAQQVSHAIITAAMRVDLLVEDLVVVELKSIGAIAPIHQAQLLSYLKLSGKSLGLLINFNEVHLKDGTRRFVNGTNWQ
jgi:GxxExxY protein